MRLSYWCLVVLFVLCGYDVSAAEPREIKIGVESGRFQELFDAQLKRGYRPIDVASCFVGSNLFCTTVWQQKPQPAFQARVVMSRSQFEQEVERLDADGYRLTHLAGSGTGGPERYSAIWEKQPDRQLRLKFAVKPEQLQQTNDELVKDSAVILRVAAVEVDGKPRLTAVWEQDADAKQATRELQAGLSGGRLSRTLRTRMRTGFRLFQLCGYVEGRTLKFVCIWEQKKGARQDVSMSLSAAALEQLAPKMERKGYRPVQITAFALNGRSLYTVVWEERKDEKQRTKP